MLHGELDTLFCAFEQAGIRWCILRLPHDPGGFGGDIDLLVDQADVQPMRRVLMRQDFVQLPGWGSGLHFLKYHRATDGWLWLHAVTELAFGRDGALKTGAEHGCLVRRQANGAIVTLAPDDAFWVLLLHCLLDKVSIAPHHRARLQELVSTALSGGPLAQTVAGVCPDGWTPGRILQCVAEGGWTDLERLGPALTAIWMRRQGIGVRQRLRLGAVQLVRRAVSLRRRRGLSVALLGPDGAGKSTLIAGIQTSFVLPVRSVYMGLTGGLLPRVDSLRVPLLVVPGRLFIFWCRYLIAQYHQIRGRLVVFDRYIYDSAVPTPHSLNWLRRGYRWIDGRACPAPDLVLVLDAPGTVMYQRKGEYTPEQLENWRQHFLALQGRVRQLEIVDTTHNQDAVRTDVIDRIWRRYADRWRES
jgi:thymidylate kinase